MFLLLLGNLSPLSSFCPAVYKLPRIAMDNKDNANDLRVASFACYLNSTADQENFMVKLGGATQDPASPVMSPDESLCPIRLERTKAKEGEISIFGADKYFNMKMEYEHPRVANDHKNSRRHGKDSSENQANDHQNTEKPKLKTGALITAPSEASYNSHTALLPSLIRSLSQTKQKRASGKRFFMRFGCNGPCSDKKAVYINKSPDNEVAIHAAKQPQSGPNKSDHFAFPVPSSSLENSTAKRQSAGKAEEEGPRKSLEVFGSVMNKKGDEIAANMERKLSMLTWDAIPKAQSIPSTNFAASAACDDMASDASSDLFEIENISGTGSYALLTRQASEGNTSGCMTPTTQYAPSEASIEWSVVTASAADFSVASDYDGISIQGEANPSAAASLAKAAKNKSSVNKAVQKSRPGGLLGCKSQKGVKVAESAHKPAEKAKQQLLDSSFSFRKPQAEARVKDIEFLRAQHSIPSRGLAS